MSEKYVVDLTNQENTELLAIIGKGKASPRAVNRAHILLLAAEDKTDEQIAAALHCKAATVARTRKRFVAGNLPLALYDRPRSGRRPKLSEHAQATLVALACSQAPDERTHWTMQLLADRLLELEGLDHLSDETVRRVLKKTYSSPGNARCGALAN